MTVLAGSHGYAQEKSPLPADVVKLINALASENAAPPAPVDIKLPRGYDRKKQKAVYRAVSKLKALGPPAFKALIENWGDERYSLTYSVGINGFFDNATVGEMCRRILFDQIQPY
ncbi:MAG: hypothetical protein ACKOGA_21920, partial [Planctomycetaceae bacterium]